MTKVAFEVIGMDDLKETAKYLYPRVTNDQQAYNMLMGVYNHCDEQAEQLTPAELVEWVDMLNRLAECDSFNNYYATELITLIDMFISIDYGTL